MKTLLFTFTCLLMLATTANAQTTPTADSLTVYVGTYSFASGSPVSKFTVTAEKDVLYGEADSYGRNKLVKQPGDDTYQSTSSYGSMITFGRDATTKAVTKLTLAAQETNWQPRKTSPDRTWLGSERVTDNDYHFASDPAHRCHHPTSARPV